MKKNMELLYITGLVLLIINKALSVPVNDQKASDELKTLKSDNQLAQLQLQLEKLQNELMALKQAGNSNQPSQAVLSVPRESDMTDRRYEDDLNNLNYQQRRGGKDTMPTSSLIDGFFYDKPVTPSVRVLVGWQPLKRLAESDPSRPSFQLSFDDGISLRQDMTETVEEHLLRDLETARKYGIEPQDILQDLRRKNNIPR